MEMAHKLNRKTLALLWHSSQENTREDERIAECLRQQEVWLMHCRAAVQVEYAALRAFYMSLGFHHGYARLYSWVTENRHVTFSYPRLSGNPESVRLWGCVHTDGSASDMALLHTLAGRNLNVSFGGGFTVETIAQLAKAVRVINHYQDGYILPASWDAWLAQQHRRQEEQIRDRCPPVQASILSIERPDCWI